MPNAQCAMIGVAKVPEGLLPPLSLLPSIHCALRIGHYALKKLCLEIQGMILVEESSHVRADAEVSTLVEVGERGAH